MFNAFLVLHVEGNTQRACELLVEVYQGLGRFDEALKYTGVAVIPEQKAINWNALNSLFERTIGLAIEIEEEEAIEPETKQKRLNHHKKRKISPRTALTASQIKTLQANYEALVARHDLRAGIDLLNAFKTSNGGGLEASQWSEAIFLAILLQVRRAEKGDFESLLRLLMGVSRESSVVAGDGRLRILAILLAFRAGNWVSLSQLARWFIARYSESAGPLQLMYLLAREKPELATILHHANNYRVLLRLHRNHPTSVPISLAVAHQSIVTSNYEEAARLYSAALQLSPNNAFIHLCLGNALFARSFQRTCPNPPITLLESLLHVKRHMELDQSVQSVYNYGRVLHMAGLLDEAVRQYRRVLQYPPARYNLSRLYLQVGSVQLAHSLYK